VRAKTGYDWTFRGDRGLEVADRGLVVLSGGTDNVYVTDPSFDPSVGLVFVQERLAQAAGHHVARHDLDRARTEPAYLLDLVTIDDTPETSPERFDAQIRQLYLDVTGIELPADAPEPAALMALWKELRSVDDSAVSAWAGVTSVVLRDPLVVLY
jgi:hypothetical protein